MKYQGASAKCFRRRKEEDIFKPLQQVQELDFRTGLLFCSFALNILGTPEQQEEAIKESR